MRYHQLNKHLALLAYVLCALPFSTSFAQTSILPNDPKFAEYAKTLGPINFLGTVKAGLNYCSISFQETAEFAKKGESALDARNQAYTKAVEAGRAAFYQFVAESDGTSPRELASQWEEKTLQSRAKKLSELKQSLLKDKTACLAYIEAVQRGQYDVKNIFPDIYQAVMGRTADNKLY